jgi:hypothetical protein
MWFNSHFNIDNFSPIIMYQGCKRYNKLLKKRGHFLWFFLKQICTLDDNVRPLKWEIFVFQQKIIPRSLFIQFCKFSRKLIFPICNMFALSPMSNSTCMLQYIKNGLIFKKNDKQCFHLYVRTSIVGMPFFVIPNF